MWKILLVGFTILVAIVLIIEHAKEIGRREEYYRMMGMAPPPTGSMLFEHDPILK